MESYNQSNKTQIWQNMHPEIDHRKWENCKCLQWSLHKENRRPKGKHWHNANQRPHTKATRKSKSQEPMIVPKNGDRRKSEESEG